jgi:xanthine dehydrogenase molybdopterin-binding subunit B
VVARELGIDISLISVKPTNTLTNTNGSVTGGSVTSEMNCYVNETCKIYCDRCYYDRNIGLFHRLQ